MYRLCKVIREETVQHVFLASKITDPWSTMSTPELEEGLECMMRLDGRRKEKEKSKKQEHQECRVKERRATKETENHQERKSRKQTVDKVISYVNI